MRSHTTSAEPISENDITADKSESFKEKFNEMVLSSELYKECSLVLGETIGTPEDNSITEETEDTRL